MPDETYSLYSTELGREPTLADLDAYAVAVREGFVGTRTEWLAQLRPPTTHLHVQPVAQSVWLVEHDLGFDPAGIVVIDDDGAVLDGWSLQYLEPGASLRLGFDIPSAGTARLS